MLESAAVAIGNFGKTQTIASVAVDEGSVCQDSPLFASFRRPFSYDFGKINLRKQQRLCPIRGVSLRGPVGLSEGSVATHALPRHVAQRLEIEFMAHELPIAVSLTACTLQRLDRTFAIGGLVCFGFCPQ